jgi:hypothetical protein
MGLKALRRPPIFCIGGIARIARCKLYYSAPVLAAPKVSRKVFSRHDNHKGARDNLRSDSVSHREAKYLMNASSAGHGTFAVSAVLRVVRPSSLVRPNTVQSRRACAHSSA